ncbi:UNVERIFIED_CONTAM: hypothetical protein K2H54_011495 [Gekko kuhli]
MFAESVGRSDLDIKRMVRSDILPLPPGLTPACHTAVLILTQEGDERDEALEMGAGLSLLSTLDLQLSGYFTGTSRLPPWVILELDVVLPHS